MTTKKKSTQQKTVYITMQADMKQVSVILKPYSGELEQIPNSKEKEGSAFRIVFLYKLSVCAHTSRSRQLTHTEVKLLPDQRS